jgi:hypothetical protein
MLIILDTSLLNTIGINTVDALNHIASSRKSGKHIVLGKRNILKALAECELLSESSRTVYIFI